jgi:tetratricopeptide (TPR) repeat protein
MIAHALMFSAMLTLSLSQVPAAAVPPQQPQASAMPAPQSRAVPVLVLPFQVDAAPGVSGLAGAPFWLGEAAAIALTDELSALGVAALSREERLTVFEALQLPLNASLTRATVIRTGEIVGASAVIIGELKLADRLSISARVIDLASGHQWADVTEIAPASEFFDLVARVAKSLAVNLAKTIAPVTLPPHPSVDAFEDYVKGLVATGPDVQIRFLEAALAHAPADPRTLIALWRARTAQGDHAHALEAASRVPADARESRLARFFAAQSLMSLKRYDEAFKALDALHKEVPAASVSNALGVLQLRRGGTPASGTPAFFFNRAVDESFGDPEIAFNLGYAYALAGDAASAVYWLREAVRREPADGVAHLVLSALLVTQAKRVEAQREFDLARMLGEAQDAAAGPVERIPRGLERLDDELYPSVLQPSAPVKQEQEQTAAYYIERGRRFADEFRDREAIDELRRAIYASPYLDQPHLLLGRVFARSGRLTDAIREFTLALWCQETAEAHASLASAQLATGKRDAARASADRALVLDPTNTLAKDVLRQLGGGAGFRVPFWIKIAVKV